MNAISKTAFFCCGIRAQDAASASPICGDTYADRFMTDEGRSILQRFSDTRRRNVSNVVRARMVQDEIGQRLEANRELQVVNIGAGFDSRAFRLAGGKWFEFDEPEIIAHKEDRVPAGGCPNPLQRVAVDFAAGELAAALDVCDGDAETLVVIEGVFMYLEYADLLGLLNTLAAKFPRHTLLCDLMDKAFFDRHVGKLHDQIRALGSEFKFVEADPQQVFLDHGYTQPHQPSSIVGRAGELGAVFVPKLLLGTVLRSLRDGYRIHAFVRVDPATSAPTG